MKRILAGAFLSSLTVCSTGCSEATQSNKPPLQKKSIADSVVSSESAIYIWNSANKGPGCMPRLRAMMDWYATQAEDICQLDFTPGEATDGPVPQGPYAVDRDAVDSYLKLLQKSGYFSKKWLDTLNARARKVESTLQHSQPEPDVAAAIKDFPLFARNYDDMLEQKQQFAFTADETGKIITLNEGDNLLRFTFDSDCKIGALEEMHINNAAQ